MQRDETKETFEQLIINNKTDELKEQLDGFSAVRSIDVANGIVLAAEHSSWSCIPVLYKYAEKIAKSDKLKNEFVQNFVYDLGEVLMLAVKANETNAVKTLLDYNILIHPNYFAHLNNCYNRQLFYKTKKKHTRTSADILRDADGSTVLHWAVKNKNPDICAALLNAWTDGHLADTGYLRLSKAVDKDNQTAYTLAISTSIECAKAIAEHYDWHYVLAHENDETAFNTLIQDIPFGRCHRKFDFDFLGYIPDYNIYPLAKLATKSNTDVRERFFNMAMELPTNKEKKSFFKNAMDNTTALGAFYAANNPNEYVELKQRMKVEYEKLIKNTNTITMFSSNDKSVAKDNVQEAATPETPRL